MKPERWRRVEGLFNAALEQKPERREDFLAEACAGDEELRCEVESLLQHGDHPGDFLDAPAMKMVARDIASNSESSTPSQPMIGKTVSHYKVVDQLGAGGMGVVYRARDTKLGRDVAVKVLPGEFARDPDRIALFQREAKILASLNHSNIAAIYGLEESDRTHFLVLELIEGDTLADRVKGGPIPVEESLKLALQIAAALEAAHKKGIIHRDLKPGNIMVTDEGLVKLLDFGLAKLYEQDASISSLPTADLPVTQAGAILGTVAYMSPEQAQGKPGDARSDIFSFGLVLYEMLSGRRAFSGGSNYAVMDAIVKKEPPPLQTSPSLERIVRRCLQKNPSARYQTVSEIRAVLENAVEEKAAKGTSEPQPSIAVLPFVNMSGDKEQEYFSDGLTEEIINALTKIQDLKVTARTSAFSFRGKEQDITMIAEALRVKTILEGSVRNSGNRIRVTAQLINAADGYHLWSERYDRDMKDIFAIQDEISQAIAEKLKVHLSGEQRLVKRPTENVEAYNLCLKGHYHLIKGFEHWTKSKEYYEQALAIDPTCALAWYGLAFYFGVLGYNGYMPSGKAHKLSREAALKSLAFDEKLAEAHSILGERLASEFDWNGAEHEFNRALELNPKSTDILHRYCLFYLIPMKRFEEASEMSEKAAWLDPLSVGLQKLLGQICLLTRQYDLAIKHLNNALELDRHDPLPYIWLGPAYMEKGEHEEGMRALKRFQKDFLDIMPFSSGMLGYYYAKAGKINEAKSILKKLHNHAQKSHESASSFALIYFGLGETDKGFDWLYRAAEEHENMILAYIMHPFLDPLRSHPRYKALLRKMNLIDTL